MSRHEYQQNFPPVEVAKGDSGKGVVPNQDRHTSAVPSEESHALAADVFDRALEAAQMTNGEAAYLLGVSESLVRKMRSRDAQQVVSLVQIFKLGPRFLWEFHKAVHRTCNFQRQALHETVQALSLFAVGMD